MDAFVETIKKHPWILAVGALIIVMVVLRSGSSASVPASAATGADPNAAENVDLATISAQSNTAAAGYNAQVAVANASSSSDDTVAQYGFLASMNQLIASLGSY